MCKNRVLRKIREREMEEVTAEWDSFVVCANCSPNGPILLVMQSRMTRWVGHVARVGEKRNAYSVLVRKSEGKRSLGGKRRRLKNIIKMHGKTWTGFVWLRIGTTDGLL